jgi:hypothetical protein
VAITVIILSIVTVMIIITVALRKRTLGKRQCSAETRQLTTPGDDGESAMDERGNYCIIVSWNSPSYPICWIHMLGFPEAGYDPLSK